jgi:hypothetical protein
MSATPESLGLAGPTARRIDPLQPADDTQGVAANADHLLVMVVHERADRARGLTDASLLADGRDPVAELLELGIDGVWVIVWQL